MHDDDLDLLDNPPLGASHVMGLVKSWHDRAMRAEALLPGDHFATDVHLEASTMPALARYWEARAVRAERALGAAMTNRSPGRAIQVAQPPSTMTATAGKGASLASAPRETAERNDR